MPPLARLALPAAVLLFVLLGLALPVIRLRVRTGVWAFTAFRATDPVERIISLALMISVLASGVWATLHSLWGPAALGVIPAPAWVGLAGWALIILGLLVIIAAQSQMGASWRVGIDDAPTELVTHGLYRWIRHPIYSAMFALIAGQVLVTPAWASLLGGLFAATAIRLQAVREERHVRELHGEAHDAWAARVGRFIPGVGRMRR